MQALGDHPHGTAWLIEKFPPVEFEWTRQEDGWPVAVSRCRPPRLIERNAR